MRSTCIICLKSIYRSNNINSVRSRRGKNTVTCCKEHARIYTRCYNYIKQVIKRRLKK